MSITQQIQLPSEALPMAHLPQDVRLGAVYQGNGQCHFTVWAPLAERVEVRLLERGGSTPRPERIEPLERDEHGYHHALLGDIAPGDRYTYRLDGEKERPDPASRAQPESVHTASQIVDPAFDWKDAVWRGITLDRYVVYELHVGTFTAEGTFDAVIPHLDGLKELGITAVEILPVAQFPGTRNWGYDGVYLFGVQHSYGGVDGIKRLVDACHQRDMALVLDVVYNHLGPEGNYLWDYGPYFTERYHTPWGAAVNYDGAHSAGVRRFFLENVLYWIQDCHIDALRLDAVHAIMDFSAHPFLEELGAMVHREAEKQGRRIYTIAESDLNDTRVIRPFEAGGFGLDAQWSDDFHHALHALVTGERDGYYADFGRIEHLLKAYLEGYVYSGQYSEHRQRHHGNSSLERPAHQFVVCAQNHDQVGNRMHGERLSQLLSFEQLKVVAGALLLAPAIPMLFMGEEYGETAPFQYFVSHGDPDLVEAVRQGRKAEFSAFAWQGEVPDPQSEETFARSRLNHDLRQQGQHRLLYDLHRELIRLRNTLPALATLDKGEHLEAQSFDPQNVLVLHRKHADGAALTLLNFGSEPATLDLNVPAGTWEKLLDTADERWQLSSSGAATALPERLESRGTVALTLAPHTCALFKRST